MVFESLVADLLNRFLGDFVDNLDSSQLNIGIWGGDVKLENLEIKETALDELDLPVKLKFGYIESLVLKIPWKNLYTEPVVATIDGVQLIVVPNKGVQYNEEKAKKNAKETKEKTLTRLEEARKNRRKPVDPQADSFSEKMVAQVIKNLQVSVHNVHVRFEDKFTNRDRPFAAGVTLASLQLQTTDSNWKKTVHKEMVKIVHKLVELDSLAVYWDSDVKLISDLGDRAQIKKKMREMIAVGEKKTGTKYILEPIKMHAKLSLNQKPETDGSNWKIPKIDLAVDMQSLTMAIGKMQYQDLLLFLEAQERFSAAGQYLKYRPPLNLFKGHYKEWWRFAYKSILMEKVRRRRENWDWNRIKKHRQVDEGKGGEEGCRDLVRRYSAAWVRRQTEKAPPSDVAASITEGEEKLDVFNVNVARQQAEMEIDRQGLTRLEDQPQGWGAWAKSWWSGGADAPVKKPPGVAGDFASKFQEAMTPEEKAKLFEAIDYQENMPPTNYPKEFVENRIDFKLGRVSIVVDGAMQMDFVGLHAAMQQRPAAGAINLKTRVSEVRMDGCGEAMLRMREKGDWLMAEVDTNPLDGGYDQKVSLRIAPVNLIYHAPAVNKAIDVFKPPESVKLNQLTAVAMSRYEEVKTRSVTGLQHAVERKSKLVLDMVIQPATIFVCDGGTFNEFKPLLLVDLGLLSISTVEASETADDKMSKLMEKAYDRFRIVLSNFVVILAENTKEAEAARLQPSSPLHILRPTGLDIQFHKCGIEDLRMPRLRIVGNLPDMVVGMSDEQLLMLLRLLLSIPKPPPDPVTTKEEELITHPKLKDRAKMKTIMEDDVELETAKEEPTDVLAKNNQQVQVQLQLCLNEVAVHVSRGSSSLISVSVLGLKCKLEMRTHDMVVEAAMGALRVAMPQHASLEKGRPHLYLVDNEEQSGPLLSVQLIQAQPESPFFATEYHNTEQAIKLVFTKLKVSLHQEGLMQLKKFGEEVQGKMNEVMGKKDEDSPEDAVVQEEAVTDAVGKKLSQVMSRSIDSLNRIRDKKSSRKLTTIDTVDVDNIINMKARGNGRREEKWKMQVEARFDALAVWLGSEKELVSEMAIEEIRANVKMMKATTDVSATLKKISVTDSAPDARYQFLVNVAGNEPVMLSFEMTQFNRDPKTKKPTDVDMKVKLRLARLRFVFINLWLSRVLLWLKPFQAQAVAAASAAQSAAAARAAKAANDVKAVMEERPPRIELDVHLDAPLIVVPRLSSSTDVIIVDLGYLQVNNKIVAEKVARGIVVLDSMTVKMAQMNVAIGEMSSNGSAVESRRHLLTPLTFSVNLDRNLMWNESKERPLAAVDMHLSTVEAKMSQRDYATIMNTLSGNLAEKVEDDDEMEVFTPPSTRTPPYGEKQLEEKMAVDGVAVEAGDRVADASLPPPDEKKTKDVQLDVKLQLDEVKAVLLADDDSGIATLSIKGLKTNAKILADGAMDVALSLAAFTMYDDRSSTKIRELMEKRGDSAEDLIKMQFEQSAQQDKKIHLLMCAFFICLNPEFLGSLARFFAVEKTEEQLEREKAEEERKKVVGGGGSSASPTTTATPVPQQGTLALDADIKGVEVILVEDSSRPESSQALILRFNCKVVSTPRADAEVMKGGVEGLHIFSSYYNVKRRDQISYEVLKKADINVELVSNRETKAMDIKVAATPLHLHVAPSIIRLLSTVGNEFSTASVKESTAASAAPRVRRFNHYWTPKPLNESNFWFFKVPTADEAVEGLGTPAVHRPVERASVLFPNISLTLEADENNVRTPLILIGCRLELTAANWTHALKANGEMALQMNYFNEAISVWEPVIEPCENEEGGFDTWRVQLEVQGRDKFVAGELACDMKVTISADRILNMTFTKSFYLLTNKLSEAFTAAAKQIAPPSGAALPGDEPFLVLNDTGVAVKIHNSATLQVSDSDRPIDATHGEYVRLRLKEPEKKSRAASALDPFAPPLQEETRIDMIMAVRGEKKAVQIGRAGKQLLELSHAPEQAGDHQAALHDTTKNGSSLTNTKRTEVTHKGDDWHHIDTHDCFPPLVLAETRVEGGRRLLTLSSHVAVQSHLHSDIEVFSRRGTTYDPCGSLSHGEKMHLPLSLLYTPDSLLFFKPASDKFDIPEEGVCWKKFSGAFCTMVECRQSAGVGDPFYAELVVAQEKCPMESSYGYTYTIHVHPPLTFQNLLPFPISVTKPSEMVLEQGDHSVVNVVPGQELKLKLTHLGESYSMQMTMQEEKPDLEVVALTGPEGKELLLGMRWSRETGGLRASLYAPFWLVNNTSHVLVHQESSTGFFDASTARCVPCKKKNSHLESDNRLVHKADTNPIILAYPSTDLTQKKKARVQVENSKWSDAFPLDVAGNASRVTCKGNDGDYDLTIDIRLCSSGLTKVVTFNPFYLVSNCGRVDMQVREAGKEEWKDVPALTCVGLYPKSADKRKMLCVRYAGAKEESLVFPITENFESFARIDDDTCGVGVSVTVAESSSVVHLTPFAPGMAPAHIINHTAFPVTFHQLGGHDSITLKPRETCMFTWADCTANRIIEFTCGQGKGEDALDQTRLFELQPDPSKRRFVYVVSFLNGRQRTLLVEGDLQVAREANGSWAKEEMNTVTEIQLHGVGLSVVDNMAGKEIMYMGISSSGILWEEEVKRGRFKPFSVHIMESLEEKYQEHLANPNNKTAQFVPIEVFQVDFNNNIMKKKKKEVKIRRIFEKGIWAQFGQSKERTKAHLKINHIQIDNQLDACVFPCMLAMIPPPKSVIQDNAPKPFLEVSLVKRQSEHSPVAEVEYLRVLTQELAVRVDQGVINALLQFISTDAEVKLYDKEAFAADFKLTETKLEDVAQSWKVQKPKSFYHDLHISPLMIHLSFSLAGTSGESTASVPIQSQFISVILKSVGVTLTDMQDVVFKLAYFERKCVFFSNEQLTGEIVSHYTRQAIKQLYVLVLGLDIIGNPFGLVRDLSSGVEDLFYQPFQGAIQGPEEFAAGMALGVQSLVGHTIGGAAGAVGRIAGTVGKGVAALTFDDEYQRKRQEEINRKPQSFTEGMARGVKGLGAGVVDGVTGVFTKPLEGARKDGAGGFVKGLGKGLVGVVTRPVSGVVDFASSTMNSVRTVAGTDRSTDPLRAPRLIKKDGIVRPFCASDAIGYKIFRDMDRGALAETDHFLGHASITEKCVLLVTNAQLVIAKRTDVMGVWTADWSAAYNKIHRPSAVEKGVKVLLKEKKKGFLGIGSSEGKIITFQNNPEQICDMILEAYDEAESHNRG